MGGFFQAGGDLIQGEASYKAAQYNAQVNRQNAVLARQQAAQESKQINIQGRKFLGEQRIGYAASGITLEGTAYDVLQETARQIKTDELSVQYQGELKARSFNSQAQMDMYQGRVARQLGYVNAAAHTVQGATDVARIATMV